MVLSIVLHVRGAVVMPGPDAFGTGLTGDLVAVLQGHHEALAGATKMAIDGDPIVDDKGDPP
jgi:hypothetical protein